MLFECLSESSRLLIASDHCRSSRTRVPRLVHFPQQLMARRLSINCRHLHGQRLQNTFVCLCIGMGFAATHLCSWVQGLFKRAWWRRRSTSTKRSSYTSRKQTQHDPTLHHEAHSDFALFSRRRSRRSRGCHLVRLSERRVSLNFVEGV